MKADLFRPEKQAYVAAVLGLFLGGAGVACLQAANVYMLWPALLAGFMAALFALLAAGRVRWSRRQAEEELAVADYRAGHAAGAELFAETDEAVKIAARASRASRRPSRHCVTATWPRPSRR